jgi:hypothetical protein
MQSHEGGEKERRHSQEVATRKQVGLELQKTTHHLETQLTLKGNELFTIMEVVSLVAYCLELLGHWAILHASLSMPCQGERKCDTSYMKSPADVIERKEKRKVKGTLNSQRHNQERQLRSLVQWEGDDPINSNWQDTMEISIPGLEGKHYQGGLAATQVLRDKNGDCFVKSATSIQHFLAPPTFTLQIYFMSDGPQQESIATIADGSTIILYLKDDAWWGQQSDSWSPPNDCSNEQQRRASYFPEISTNLPEITSTPGPSNSFTFSFAELPCANPHSDAGTEAVKDSATQQAGDDASRTPKPQETVPDPINKRWWAQICERHPDGRFKKKRCQPPGTAVPDPATEPAESTQPTWDLSDSPTSSNSDPDRSRRVCAKPGDGLCASTVSPTIGGWSTSSGPGTSEIVVRNP